MKQIVYRDLLPHNLHLVIMLQWTLELAHKQSLYFIELIKLLKDLLCLRNNTNQSNPLCSMTSEDF